MSEGAIVRASPDDAGALGIIGPAAYAAHYAYLWDDPAALARRLTTFGAHAFDDLLARPEARVWVARLDGATIGFLSMILGSPDPIRRRPHGAELPRIYLLPGATGMGFGHRLLDAAAAEAAACGCDHLWLDVMASATAARAIYRSWDFNEIGTATFDHGVRPGMEPMAVMSRELPGGG